MQLMSWTIARLGSRFSLYFEPYRRQVMHSALGRLLDQPLDLQVGLIEPDGTQRVLPFSRRGSLLCNVEQFERANSLTIRGFSEKYRLRFELNVHAVFYPQDEPLCVAPVFFLEMRLNPVDTVRWYDSRTPRPRRCPLFIRLGRANTSIEASESGRIDLHYANALEPIRQQQAADAPAGAAGDGAGEFEREGAFGPSASGFDVGSGSGAVETVEVRERIQSLNEGCRVSEDGRGLELTLPVTETGSGTKWRLVWGAYCSDPIIRLGDRPGGRSRGPAERPAPGAGAGRAAGAEGQGEDAARPGADPADGVEARRDPDDKVASQERPPTDEELGRFRYCRWWPDLDSLMEHAVAMRDDWLAHSRRFEKLFDQASLEWSQRHIFDHSFQAFLSNTFWCDVGEERTPWFSVWEGASRFHSTIEAEYYASLFYLTLWPGLLGTHLDQWPRFAKDHPPSGGRFLRHDLGAGLRVGGQGFPHDMPVEDNCNYLLLHQAYAHWTGDLTHARHWADALAHFARFLIWSDRNEDGFVNVAALEELFQPGLAELTQPNQTYMAVKRLAALQAAADLLRLVGEGSQCQQLVERCERIVEQDMPKIEHKAWLGDHYAVQIEPGEQAPSGEELVSRIDTEFGVPGWDAYSIYTGNALLLPAMIGQPPTLDPRHFADDLVNATRETLTPYGCAHTSADFDHIWISQNAWRDCLAQYFYADVPRLSPRYWDMQVMSNTHQQSLGFVDTYVTDQLAFYPRGITSIGTFCAAPRLVIDRLAPGGERLCVDPDRNRPQRWPLLALADWRAGKIPVCVVDDDGGVSIEGEIDPIIIRGQAVGDTQTIG